MRQIVLAVILLLLVCSSVVAQATTYYISPTGSNSNNGLSSGAPFLTFAYALDPTRASCGDTLNLANGVYGDGTSTGKLSLVGRICTVGNQLTIRASNSRQARINDNGTGIAFNLSSGTAYIIFDGVVGNSTNNDSSISGAPFYANDTDHIKIKNSLFRNPNKYANQAVIGFVNSRDGLVEDTEMYDYHRHGITFFTSQRMTARRVYGNSRLGKIPGSFGLDQGPLGSGAALVSMYPCTDCILENGIGEGESYLNEMNATFNSKIMMSGSKVLGSICYHCGPGNGIYLNSRPGVGSNYSPQNITIQHNAIVEHENSTAIRATSVVTTRIDHNTVTGNGAVNGVAADDSANGATMTSVTVTNNIATGFSSLGFSSSGYTTWSGAKNFSNGNGTNYSPALPLKWSTGTASVTTDPQMGTCYAWAPDGSAAKLAGAGARILYRYQNGVLTNVPLWNPTTGEFPYGALVEGLNDVAGRSLCDVHKRLNVNRNGCSFPADYGAGGTDEDAPSTPTNLSVF